MSYTKQNFTAGQILKSSQLNYMEDAIVNNIANIENNTSDIKILENNINDVNTKISNNTTDISEIQTIANDAKTTADNALPENMALKVKYTYKAYSVTANTKQTITPSDAGFTGYNTIYAALPFILATPDSNDSSCHVSASGTSNVVLLSPTTQTLYVVIYYLYI